MDRNRNINTMIIPQGGVSDSRGCMAVFSGQRLKRRRARAGTSSWMYNKSWIGLGLGGHYCNFILRYCSEKSLWPKKHFLQRHHYKRDVNKTVDRTTQIANNINYDSFHYEFLIHEGCIFFKTLVEPRKVI